MKRFFRAIGAFVFPLIAVREVVDILGLKWSKAIEALNDIGLQFLED